MKVYLLYLCGSVCNRNTLQRNNHPPLIQDVFLCCAYLFLKSKMCSMLKLVATSSTYLIGKTKTWLLTSLCLPEVVNGKGKQMALVMSKPLLKRK